MRPISLIIIHCTATPNGRRVPPAEIDQWHAARGFHREQAWRERQNHDLKAIGYHYIIQPTGLVETGRHPDEIGAHAHGYNQKSIGIALAGTDAYTPEAWDTLAHVITAELARITDCNGPTDRRGGLTRDRAFTHANRNGIRIAGHRDLPEVRKTCPGFDVDPWLHSGLAIPATGIYAPPTYAAEKAQTQADHSNHR